MKSSKAFRDQAGSGTILAGLVVIVAVALLPASALAGEDNAVFVVSPDGSFVMVQLGPQDAGGPTVIDADGQVLAQGVPDCVVHPDYLECDHVAIRRGEDGHGLARPLVVIAWAEDRGIRVDLATADFPPPLVRINGVVVNR